MGYISPGYAYVYCGFGSYNPGDSTLYYFGAFPSGSPSSQGVYLVYFPTSGVIRAAVLDTYATTVGTAEDWTIAIRKNNTTDYTFATVGAATAHRLFANYSLSIPIAAGDYIEFKTTTPAWATNPEGLRGSGTILLETA